MMITRNPKLWAFIAGFFDMLPRDLKPHFTLRFPNGGAKHIEIRFRQGMLVSESIHSIDIIEAMGSVEEAENEGRSVCVGMVYALDKQIGVANAVPKER